MNKETHTVTTLGFRADEISAGQKRQGLEKFLGIAPLLDSTHLKKSENKNKPSCVIY
jgi:hypothetical protein